MAFKTLKAKRAPITLEELGTRIDRRRAELAADEGFRRVSFPEFAEALARRRAELGDIDIPRNSGKRRTASKRALLKAIEEAGGKW
jgi:hypothetical protein